MENNTEKRLTVYMLNGFSIMYGEDVLSLEKFGNSKLIELFQILLRYKKSGISREQLLQMLYEDDSIADKSHSLDSLVYRLKRVLKQTFPEQDEFLSISNGIYKWIEKIPVLVDVLEFESLLSKAEEAEAEDRKKCFISAFYWYDSEFLDDRPMRPWILEERMRLKKIYAVCVSGLGKIFEEEKDYRAMHEVYSKAAALYPYDEWQIGQILALQYLNKYTEAYHYYQETVKKYFDELKLPPSHRMLNIIQNTERHIKNPTETLDEIKERLQEDGDRKGAYYCTYPGFVNVYRYISRLNERSGQSVFFMLCSVYYLNPDGRRSPRAGDLLSEAIGKTLRKGDCFTRYSEYQFLIILTGTQNENCERIFERIRKSFKRVNRNSNCELEYLVAPVQNMIEVDGEIRFRNGKKLWDTSENNDAKMEK